MYSKSTQIGKIIRTARKNKNMTIEEFSKKLFKSDTTAYKYERDEIVPDFLTIIDICNILDLDLNDFTQKDRIEISRENSVNPFNTDILYIYYFYKETMDIAEYRLKLTPENGLMKVEFLLNDNSIYYTGTIESNTDRAFISLKNYFPVNRTFEKLQMTVNMKYAKDDRNMGIILALQEEIDYPVIKKFILTRHKLNNKEKEEIINRLVLNEEEKEKIINTNSWYADIRNNTGFKEMHI